VSAKEAAGAATPKRPLHATLHVRLSELWVGIPNSDHSFPGREALSEEMSHINAYYMLRRPLSRALSLAAAESRRTGGFPFQETRKFSGSNSGPNGVGNYGGGQEDKLVLKGLLFHGFHGVLREERVLGQKFLVDIDAYVSLSKAAKSDDIKDSVSYADVYSLVRSIVEGPPHDLLESLSDHLVHNIFTVFPPIWKLRILLAKPHVAVIGPIDYLGVEIVRTRGG